MPDVLIEGVMSDASEHRRATAATHGRSLQPTARRLIERVIARELQAEGGPEPPRRTQLSDTPPADAEDLLLG